MEQVEGDAAYGQVHSDQWLRFRYTRNASGVTHTQPLKVCVCVHGGFWRNTYGVDNSGILPLAQFFLDRGYLVVIPEV